MTQIKLRRDTAANFTSKNPVLGVGEPAYETDTKKLKIGDGTTAYTQFEYFSAGGGGSTNITATLPLKIVDGVISLEVDGQTIQIVDGKLHANLDGLSNEVNSLTGRVTAAEADILTKENKITTTGALSLQEKIISNLTNMTETETQITPNINQPFVVNPSEFYFSFPSGSITSNPPQCYIAIPYQFGQWLKIPGGYNTQPSVFFGHFLEDGDFLITAVFSGNCYESNHPIYGGIVRGTAPVSFSTYSGTFHLNSYGSVSEKAMNSNIIFTETDPCAYLQLIDNTSSGNIICGSYNYGYGPNSYGVKGYGETHVVYNRDLTNYTVQDFVRDTTTALIMSPYTDKPILKSAVGLYAATGRLGWSQEGYDQLKANLGENLFDLTKSQVNNYLELNLGDGLSVVDGKLTASSTAPTNMVTTNTTQTITGNKTFRYIGVDDAYGGKTRLGNGQSKIEMAYDGQISLDSATILADQSQNWRVGRYNKAGLIYSASPLKRVGDGPTFTNYDILDSSNLGSHVDGTTITYADGKLKATYTELNNPYSLFDSKYSDHELNNLSWLKSEGQWNAKAVYPDAYDKLLKVYNGTETVEGLSVKLSTEEYTDYDFVLNTTDETFRLPLLDGSENILSNERINYDLPTASGQTYTAQYNGSVQFNATTTGANQYIRLYNQTSGQIAEQRPPANNVGSVSYIAVKKGDVFQITGDAISTVKALYLIKAKGNGSLYFYVGETVQNANLIDAGRIGEQLATKTDMLQASSAGMPSNKYIDLTLGAKGSTYTAPANGWFWLLGNWTNADGYVQLKSVQKFYCVQTPNNTISGYHGLMLPITKGDSCMTSYNTTPKNVLFRFIYAEGSK